MKDIFDMNVEEFSAYLAPVAEAAARQSWEQDLYISYPAKAANLPGAFIYEYRNGKNTGTNRYSYR